MSRTPRPLIMPRGGRWGFDLGIDHSGQSRRGDYETIPSFDVLGVPVSVTSLDAASKAIHRWARDDRGRFVCIRDVHGVMQAQQNSNLLEAHRSAAMVTPDGMPLVWIGRGRGLPVSRTCGPDLMERVLRDSEGSGLTHYFYGGKAGVAQRLAEHFDGAVISGSETPPFRDLSDGEIERLARRIRDSAADVVWIGLSTPRQELLMRQLAPLVPATLIGVGAAFDFHAGVVKRAPAWMQRCGLEWAFRLAREPRRLWRRYLVMAPRFLLLLIRNGGGARQAGAQS